VESFETSGTSKEFVGPFRLVFFFIGGFNVLETYLFKKKKKKYMHHQYDSTHIKKKY
jgi:hypothetical protein